MISTKISRNILFLSIYTGWESDYGGFTSYIAKGEDEEVCCKSENFRKNFIFANRVNRHIWGVKNSPLGHDVPKSVNDRVILPFREDSIFTNM